MQKLNSDLSICIKSLKNICCLWIIIKSKTLNFSKIFIEFGKNSWELSCVPISNLICSLETLSFQIVLGVLIWRKGEGERVWKLI